MEKRKIGNSDLYCSSIGFGTWEMSSTMYGEIDINDIYSFVVSMGFNIYENGEGRVM